MAHTGVGVPLGVAVVPLSTVGDAVLVGVADRAITGVCVDVEVGEGSNTVSVGVGDSSGVEVRVAVGSVGVSVRVTDGVAVAVNVCAAPTHGRPLIMTKVTSAATVSLSTNKRLDE